MKKIIIASHHQLAQGFKDTLNYIVPVVDAEIMAISAYTTNTPVEQEISDALKDIQPEDEVIVFTDLLGGSVNQAFVPYLSNPHVHVIAGMSLPLILTVVLTLNEQKTTPEQFRNSIKEAKEQIVYVNDHLAAQAIDEDDE